MPQWLNAWPEDEDLDDLEPDEGDREPCAVAGCGEPGVVIVFRGLGEEDRSTTMGRFCPAHVGQLFDLSGGGLRPRAGVDLDAVVPRPPSARQDG